MRRDYHLQQATCRERYQHDCASRRPASHAAGRRSLAVSCWPPARLAARCASSTGSAAASGRCADRSRSSRPPTSGATSSGRSAATHVAVTAVITDPAADPHSFEPNAQAQLAISKAQLLVENGGGYDDWMTDHARRPAAAPPRAGDHTPWSVSRRSDAAAPAQRDSPTQHICGTDAHGAHRGGRRPRHGETNEHVWYDLPTVKLAAPRSPPADRAAAGPGAAVRATADAFTAGSTS